ncbi:MAG: response regulator [Deltaproteobacteria bacterium]|nr:response regulator [Deltaproteobacteria bacterium]
MYYQKILVVVTQWAEYKLIKNFLRGDFKTIDMALSEVEASFLISNKEYDAIITDHTLPEIDGLGLYANITKNEPRYANRFIFLTSPLRTQQAEPFGLTGRPHIMRPLNLNRLKRVIENVS